MRQYIGLGLIVALSILAALAADLRDALWAGYRDYASPYLAALPSGSSRPGLSPRTVVVLVRGLKLDTSKRMPALNALRERGADNTMLLQPPSYAVPSWLRLFSGAGAPVHGVTNNRSLQIGQADTLLLAMRLAGQTAVVIGSERLFDALGGDAARFEPVDSPDMNERDDLVLQEALRVLGDPVPAQLVVLELASTEQAAWLGEASYAAAAAATDRRIQALVDALDLNTSTLVVASDRGVTNLDRTGTLVGRDGGGEPEVAQAPLVLAGAAIRPGSQSIVAAIDLAPTLAALVGAPMPVHNQGQIIVANLLIPDDPGAAAPPETNAGADAGADAGASPRPAQSQKGELLWASAIQLTAFYEHWSEVIGQPRFAAEMLRQAQEQIKAGDERAYQAFTISLTAQAQAEQIAQLTAERAVRLPVLIGAALLLVAPVGIFLGSGLWQPLIGTLIYLAAWFVLFNTLRDFRHSLSMFADSDPRRFLDTVSRDAAIVAIVLGLLVALTTGGHNNALQALTTVMSVYGLMAITQFSLAAWFYWQWDIAYTWILPDSTALVAALVAMAQAAGLSARLAPGLPPLPIPLMMGIATLAIYSLLHRRSARRRAGALELYPRRRR